MAQLDVAQKERPYSVAIQVNPIEKVNMNISWTEHKNINLLFEVIKMVFSMTVW